MAYTIKAHEGEKYISVVTEGTLDIKEITAMGREFVQREIDTGIRSVLLDIRKSRIKANIIDAFTFTSKSKIPILEGEKNAILITPKYKDKMKVNIYVMQSNLCGLHSNLFTDEKQAIDWLCGK